MGCLHSKDIVYRDLKPKNVLLDTEGHIKIINFINSKQNVGENDMIMYSMCDTPEYLAPEIIKKVQYNRSADWWSLGVLLYEMLSGRPPHHNKDR